jgi:hypothetical protein
LMTRYLVLVLISSFVNSLHTIKGWKSLILERGRCQSEELIQTRYSVLERGIGCFPGWSSSVNGICIRCASHVCGLWSDIHRPEKAQCEIYCQVSPCVANCSLHWLFLFCESSWCDTVLCEAVWKQCS